MKFDSDELAQKEAAGELPRMSLFSQKLNSDLLDERFIRNLSKEKINRYRHLPISITQLLEAYRITDQYDAVISWSERLGIPFALLLKMTCKRVPHLGLFSWISSLPKATLLKRAQSHFDKIILMSSSQRDFAVQRIGISSEKVELLKWPVDQIFWTPWQVETDMICTVGREMRDYQTFVKAMEGLSIRCHIAAGGRTNDKLDEWKKVLDNEALIPPNITIGSVPFNELRGLYARSKFVVIPLLPTDTDNGSTTILEAMAMGKAVICTKTAGQKDIIKDGENGIFVPQGDVRALKNAIEYLWKNPEMADRMGKEGRKLIEQCHSWDGFVEDVRRITENVVDDFQSNSYKQPNNISGLRVLTLVTTDLAQKKRSVLRQLQTADHIPRVLLYEDVLHSVVLRKDYFEDTPCIRRLFYRFIPSPVACVVEAFIVRKNFKAIICWSASSAILFATILKITQTRYPTIALLSWLSKPKKAFFLKLVVSHIDKIVLWSSVQMQFARNELKIPEKKIALVSRRVDHTFWRPESSVTDIISSVGEEMRDYATLLKALDGLAIRCHIALGAFSGVHKIERESENHSQIEKNADSGPKSEVHIKNRKSIFNRRILPPNITLGSFTPLELRSLYARSRFVVIPLHQSDTDNGVTTMEEAMAMGKAVICTGTKGQVDILKDQKTGLVIPPYDHKALRDAILYLWNNPSITEQFGREGRKYIETHHTLDHFVECVKKEVDQVIFEYHQDRKVG